MYKDIKKNKGIRRYMGALVLHTGAPKVHLKDNKSCIYVAEAKIVTTRAKHIGITVYFLQEQLDNDIFITKYDSLVSFR